jgi:hypothetical protein
VTSLCIVQEINFMVNGTFMLVKNLRILIYSTAKKYVPILNPTKFNSLVKISILNLEMKIFTK